MCARYCLFDPEAPLEEEFEVHGFGALKPRYNIAPASPVLAVIRGEEGRDLRLFHWGLVPSWMKDPSKGTINARAESASDKPMFRYAFRHRRCLIPASGYFEWKTESGKKHPYLFRRMDGRPMALAGLWEIWEGPDGYLESCAVLTTEANELASTVHDRMPVILERDAARLWLSSESKALDSLNALTRPIRDGYLTAFAVDHRVGNPRFDQVEAIRPISQLF